MFVLCEEVYELIRYYRTMSPVIEDYTLYGQVLEANAEHL